MKFNLNRKEALTAARKAALAAATRSPVMELTGILIEVDENTGQVSFLGTDLGVAIKCELQADVESGGAAVVNAFLLVGMLNLLAGDRVLLELTRNGLLHVKAGSAEYTVATLPPENFPKMEIPAPDSVVRLSGVCSLEKFTTFAAAKKDTKQKLECVRMEIGKDTVRAVACDGYRMTATKAKLESGGSLDLLLPASSLHTLAGLVNDDDILYLGIKNRCAVFFRPGLYFSTRTVDGPYLDVDALIGKPGEYQAMTKASDFGKAVETVAAVSDGYSSVGLRLQDGKILFSCDGPGGVEAHTAIDAQVFSAMPDGAAFCYPASSLCQGVRLLEGMLAVSMSKAGVLIVTNGAQKYMQTPRRPKKRPAKAQADESNQARAVPEKKPAKKKTAKTKKTAAKAA